MSAAGGQGQRTTRKHSGTSTMETVGEYEYHSKDLIGHGAFAVVYKGRLKKNNNFVVAIKSITKKNLAKSQSLLGKEIKILKELTELHHENVVALLDCKETSSHVFLVMEYCNGGDLADYLNAKGTLSEDTIRLFLRQLAGAMKALHAKGIVHRDLKPQNILLSHAGKPNPKPHEIKLKIADFGFARFLQDGVMAATLCGSPMYMAPEVIMSLQYDAKADLWSLGTIVFQCLTGKAPFQAHTPQALKQYYERNANLAPEIPPGTSGELANLLLSLLKRNSKDRMEFDSFFNHPFLKNGPKLSSPMAVPSPRQRSCEPSPGHTPVAPEAFSPVGGGGANLPAPSSPLAGHLPPSPGGLYPEAMKSVEDQSRTETPSTPTERYSVPGSPSSPKALGPSSSPEEHDDFVLVPSNIPSDQSCDSAGSGHHRGRELYDRGYRGAQARSPVTLHHGGGAAYHKQQPPALASPPRPSFLPITAQADNATGVVNNKAHHHHNHNHNHPQVSSQSSNANSSSMASEPIPVPTQKEAYQHIMSSLLGSSGRGSRGGNNNVVGASSSRSSSPVVVLSGNRQGEQLMPVSPSSSPKSPPKGTIPRSQPISMKRTASSDMCKVAADIRSLSPPAVQFSLGNSPSGGRRRTASGSSCGTPPPITTWQVSPSAAFFPGRQTPTSSPLRRSGRMTPPHLGAPFFTGAQTTLPPILGSPVKLMEYDNTVVQTNDRCGNPTNVQTPIVPFGGRAMTLPEMARHGSIQRKASLGGTLPESPEGMAFGVSPPGMEGPIMFVAPELPEETLLEKEHNETLAKLNFVLALIDCIVELAKTRNSPLAVLTESVLMHGGSSTGGSQSFSSEGRRRSEQVVLYVKALQLLSSALNLARNELQVARLQPSASVKNVVSVLNERFRHCLAMCKQLNSSSMGGVAGGETNTTAVSADQLLYQHALDICQSAAMDELFGNPEECFSRYQTAQILLHSLAQQVHNEADKTNLLRYKDAVERRLFCLQQQGYIYAYDTT